MDATPTRDNMLAQMRAGYLWTTHSPQEVTILEQLVAEGVAQCRPSARPDCRQVGRKLRRVHVRCLQGWALGAAPGSETTATQLALF